MHRISLSLILFIIITVIGLGWAFDQLYRQYADTTTNKDAVSVYKNMGQQLANLADNSNSLEDFSNSLKVNNGVYITINKLEELALPNELQNLLLSKEVITLESSDDISLHFYLPSKAKVLSIALPNTERAIHQSKLSLVFTLIFYSTIIALISLWLYPLIKQLKNLREKSFAFGQGNLDTRIESPSISYLADIEKEFNQMAQRIQTLIIDNKLLGNAVSHDLRTPLARLRFGIDALEETKDLAFQKKYIERMTKDISEMENLVEILLNYARLEQSMLDIKKQDIDICHLTNECFNMAKNDKLSMQFVSLASQTSIEGDARYLGILINNLLQNALQHAKNKIIVSFDESDNQVTLHVEDDGAGIPEAKRSDVLKPFIRGQNDNKGFGMGLAIVKRIAEWHDGSVIIENSMQLNGAKISITLPKKL